MNSENQKVLEALLTQYHHLVQAEQYEQALEMAKLVYQLCPNEPKHLVSLGFVCLHLCRFERGVEYAKQALALDEHYLPALDILAHLYGGLSDWEACGRYGHQALVQRDRDVMKRAKPFAMPSEKHSGQQRIIAFSLFGNLSKYIETAVLNTELVNYIYPGWRCRFYIDDSVSAHNIARLQQNGAEIIRVNDQVKQWPGAMWRFLAINDPDIAYVVFRDADSVISFREAAAVGEWIKSGKQFHTMRDSGSHTELVLAGMWGCMGGAIPDVQGKIQHFLDHHMQTAHFADQDFLREIVWVNMRESLCAHDRIFHFFNARPFPDLLPFHPRYQIGSCEAFSIFHAEVDYPEGSKVVWRLFSKVAPLLNIDGTPNLQADERLVCSYEAMVCNGQISGCVPYRYGSVIEQGFSRISISSH